LRDELLLLDNVRIAGEAGRMGIINMNFEEVERELMNEYTAASRRFWRTEFCLVAVIGVIVLFPSYYFLTSWLAEHVAAASIGPNAWWHAATVTWFLAMAMPIQIMHPKKPTHHDVHMAMTFRKHRHLFLQKDVINTKKSP
jgi:hypothetical protein